MKFRYKVLDNRTGMFTYANNGIELDQLVKQGIERGMSVSGMKISIEVERDEDEN